MQTHPNSILMTKELLPDLLLANFSLFERTYQYNSIFALELIPLHCLPLIGSQCPVIAIIAPFQRAPSTLSHDLLRPPSTVLLPFGRLRPQQPHFQ